MAITMARTGVKQVRKRDLSFESPFRGLIIMQLSRWVQRESSGQMVSLGRQEQRPCNASFNVSTYHIGAIVFWIFIYQFPILML